MTALIIIAAAVVYLAAAIPLALLLGKWLARNDRTRG